MRELQLTILSHNGEKKEYIYIFFFFFFSFLLSVVINYGGSENEKEEVEEYIFTSVASLSGATSLVLLRDPLWSKHFEAPIKRAVYEFVI